MFRHKLESLKQLFLERVEGVKVKTQAIIREVPKFLKVLTDIAAILLTAFVFLRLANTESTVQSLKLHFCNIQAKQDLKSTKKQANESVERNNDKVTFSNNAMKTAFENEVGCSYFLLNFMNKIGQFCRVTRC